jgi:outer membrane protein assembly factor BamB
VRRCWALALVALAGCRAIPLNADPTFGSHEDVTSLPQLFEVDWWRGYVKAPLLDYQPAETANPAVDPDSERVFISTRDGALRCLSPFNGAIEWEFKTSGRPFAGPMVRDGVVYMPAGNGSLYALRSTSGEKLWSYSAGEELVTQPTIDEGKVLVASQADTVYAVNAESGAWVWQYRRDPPSGFTVRGASRPVVRDGLVFMGFADGTLVALGLDDGVVRWERRLTTSGGTQFLDVDSTPVVDSDGRLYVASYKDGLYALKADTGDIVWNDKHSGVNGLVQRGRVLFATGDGKVTAHDALSGRVLWSLDVSDRTSKGPGTNAGRPPMFARGYLVVPTATSLAFIEPSSGKVRMAWDPGKGVTATPLAVASLRLGNRLYVLSNGGSVFALQVVGTGS